MRLTRNEPNRAEAEAHRQRLTDPVNTAKLQYGVLEDNRSFRS